MFDDGVLKFGDDGKPVPVNDEMERESIRSQMTDSKRRKTMTNFDANAIQEQLGVPSDEEVQIAAD